MWLRGIVSSYLTHRYLTTSGDASTAHTDARKPGTHQAEAKDKAARYRMWYRILSNLMAALLICLSLLMLGIVIGQGTFHREVVQYHSQDESIYWNDFGANCLLRPGGFVPHSCAFDETNITDTIEAWDGFGVALAAALNVPPHATYRVSTCWMGATPVIGWASFQVVVGYDYFPACNPTNGSQLVAGVAMLETAARPGFPLGVYLLTAFSDARMNTSYSYVGSDGVATPIVAGLSHTIITPNGTVYTDDIGMNSVITSRPLGPRYEIVSYNIGQIVNMTPYLGTVAGWCTGRDSKLPVLTGWFVGHTVMNGDELLALQLIFSALSIYLFAGDVYMTIEGLNGVLRSKPVLTYDVLSGLERRKLLMLCITLNSMPSILYIDVARIYYGTDSGLQIWAIATISLSIFAAFMGFLAITLLQYLPAAPKLRYKLVSFSAPLFLYGSIGFVAGNIQNQMQTLNLQFSSGAFNLAFYARGTLWASGAYADAGAPTAIGQLLPRMWPPVLWALLIATVYTKLMHFLEGRPLLVHIEWASTNDFLSACGLPKYISSMPLGQHQGIKIGNRTFCKPSTQVLFGYASVVPVASSKKVLVADPKKEDPDIELVSVYDLVWAVFGSLCSFRPARVGSNVRNHFTAIPRDARRLPRNKQYAHTRGSAID